MRVVLFTLITLFFIAGCANAESVTVVVAALEAEAGHVKGKLENAEERFIQGIKFTVGEIHGRKVVVAVTGVGKVNAAMTTALLINHFRPSEVISTGVAGALNPTLSPGDIIVATKTAQHDLGILDDKGLTNRGLMNPITGGKNPTFFPCSLRLVNLAETAAMRFYIHAKEEREFAGLSKILKGVIVSGDVFISSHAKRNQLRKDFTADAVEMEAAAVAQVCWQIGTPYIAIRSISDLADAGADGKFGKTHRWAAEQAGNFVLQVIEQLNK